jgi:hypothetical protein
MKLTYTWFQSCEGTETKVMHVTKKLQAASSYSLLPVALQTAADELDLEVAVAVVSAAPATASAELSTP